MEEIEIFKFINTLKPIKKQKLKLSQKNQWKLIKNYCKNRKQFNINLYTYLNSIIIFMIENLKTVDQAINEFKKESHVNG